jgi:hypothetical protein
MRRQLYTIAFLFSAVVVLAQEQAAKKLFSVVPSSYSGVTFRNDIIEDANLYYYKYEYLYIGNGVAVGDINNDGLQDIYFSSTTGFNKLYLNLGNFKFKDISETAGIGGELGLKTSWLPSPAPLIPTTGKKLFISITTTALSPIRPVKWD